jgi:hypothetical protein
MRQRLIYSTQFSGPVRHPTLRFIPERGELMERFLGLVGFSAFMAVAGALLFGCAGRWDLPMFWAYLGVGAASGLVGIFTA